MMLIKRGVTCLLRSRLVNRAVRVAARARGHGLVLVYHRVGTSPPSGCRVLPTVPVDVFRAHVQVLGEVADLVPLSELLAWCGDNDSRVNRGLGRPAIALTFDDDLPSHLTEVLPILRAMRVPATFFLSGRALLDRGPYWFQQLEALLQTHGTQRTAALLGLPSAATSLPDACEHSTDMQQRVSRLSSPEVEPPVLTPQDIATLSSDGMAIGFHTVNHCILPELDDATIRTAVTWGRQQLEATVGRDVLFFAYPHGKADARSARIVRESGFAAAFTGRSQPIGPRAHRYLLGRWEPGPLSVDELLVRVAVRLHRASPAWPGTEAVS